MIQKSIYEISEIGELEIIISYLKTDQEFIELDRRGHQMYSAGINNYFKFASGQGFKNIHDDIKVLDIEMPVKDISNLERKEWHRSSIIKSQTIESAGFQCEIDSCHNTFIAKSTGHQYMEGHHAIPMKKQDRFDKSLDIYANVICLCPVCHRYLHYGIDSERKMLVDKIYNQRVERLVNCGIRLSNEEFENMAI